MWRRFVWRVCRRAEVALAAEQSQRCDAEDDPLAIFVEPDYFYPAFAKASKRRRQ
jgi:hypothetical protein